MFRFGFYNAIKPTPIRMLGGIDSWTPAELTTTLWLEASDSSTITETGGLVSQWDDKSGNDNHATQGTAADQPLFETAPNRITFSTSDRLISNLPATVGTLVLGTTNGTTSYEVDIDAGNYEIGRRNGFHMPDGTAYEYIISTNPMTETDKAKAIDYIQSKGAGDNYGSITNFTSFWESWYEITEFPVIDTSSGTTFSVTWGNCSRLTSFPVIDTSSGITFSYAWGNCSSLASFPVLDFSSSTSFLGSWRLCSSLTDFPANVFDGCSCINFDDAFVGTNLTQQSIDNILVSIESNGTSNGTFKQSGGSAPSAVGLAAVSSLVGRGWSVTVTT